MYAARHDRLTVREIARLQGFRDDFEFRGNLEMQYHDVSSAHPPLVSQIAAEHICRVLQSIPQGTIVVIMPRRLDKIGTAASKTVSVTGESYQSDTTVVATPDKSPEPDMTAATARDGDVQSYERPAKETMDERTTMMPAAKKPRLAEAI